MWRYLLLPLFFWNIQTSQAYTCKTEDNKTVDWYIAYKFPGGGDYAYLLPNSNSWTKSKYSTNQTKGILYNTIVQAYRNQKEPQTFYAFYNDQKPAVTSAASGYWFGHMKGVLAFKRQSSGFWLIHSTPHFPSKQQYGFPKSGLRYGQTFICVTFDYRSLANITQQLLVALPQVYSFALPTSVAGDVPDLKRVVKHKGRAAVNQKMVSLRSAGGVAFTHFAKSVAFNKDLYSSLVAPSLKVSVAVEGWRDGPGDLPSNCSGKYQVENIKQMRFNSFKIDFTTTKDHSKWCISKDQTIPWVCVGDINRQKSQFRRGGGTLCFGNAKVWKQFNSAIYDVEKC